MYVWVWSYCATRTLSNIQISACFSTLLRQKTLRGIICGLPRFCGSDCLLFPSEGETTESFIVFDLLLRPWENYGHLFIQRSGYI